MVTNILSRYTHTISWLYW